VKAWTIPKYLGAGFCEHDNDDDPFKNTLYREINFKLISLVSDIFLISLVHIIPANSL
jgi:hypothetical protein